MINISANVPLFIAEEQEEKIMLRLYLLFKTDSLTLEKILGQIKPNILFVSS